jgi:cytochrome c-type biogenesis protein
VLPIVPAYLSVITGLDVAEVAAGERHHLGRIARDTTLFIGGFSVVFVLLGLSATAIGRSVFRHHAQITRVSGLVVLAMALFLGASLVLRAPWLYQEKRFHPRLSRFGVFAAPVAGAAFGFGWTPCIGPILSSVLVVAATRGKAWEGGSLMAAYSLGLGLPFLATGLAFGRLAGTFRWVKCHFTGLTLAASISMGFFGVLLTFNRLTWVTTQVQDAVRAVGLGRLVNLG